MTKNSTITSAPTQAEILERVTAYCLNMHKFFDLVEHEIEFHSNDAFDGIEFLTEAAKTQTLELGHFIYAAETGGEA